MADKLDIKFLNSHKQIEKFCKNSTNSIEDPIFTGFTFAIDKPHSPLFYSVCEQEFTDSLRSPGGTNTDTAESIESKLEVVNRIAIGGFPNTYEINTIEAKDPFGATNERRPGYGLWEKHYIDNVLYGAADYIYMVDKVRTGMFSDDYGVSDLGNGTPNDNIYEEYIDTIDSISNVNILFEYNKDEVWNSQIEKYTNLVNTLKTQSDASVKLLGYASKETDDDSKIAYNLDLSRRRVETVKGYLINNGIDSSRIITAYYGETRQFSSTTLADNRVVVCNICSQGAAVDMAINNATVNLNDSDLQAQHTANENAYNEAKKAYEEVIYGKDSNGNIKRYSYSIQSNNETKVLEIRWDPEDGNTGASEYMKNKAKLELKQAELENDKLTLKMGFEAIKSDISEYQEILKKATDGTLKTTTASNVNSTWESVKKITGSKDSDLDSPPSGTTSMSWDTIMANWPPELVERHKNLKSPTEASTTNTSSAISATFKFPTTDELNNEVERLTNEMPNYKDESGADKVIRKIAFINKTSLTNVDSSGASREIQALKDAIRADEQKLFGVDENGNTCNESNAREGSLYFKYKQAEDTYMSDGVSQIQGTIAQLNDIKDNLENIKEYQDYANTKNQTTRNSFSSTPVTDTTDKKKRTRPVYEVPQTVYDMMGFIKGMEAITSDYPYVLQTITGLDEAYKNYFEIKDPYMGSGDNKITIECLEFLDLRVSSMFNKYFNAVYDRQYRRERVPINLRRFNCSVFVHDIRNFKDSIKTDNIVNSGDLKLITEIALNYMSAIEFKFFDCEIVPNETGNIFNNIANNTAGEMKNTNFSFTYGNCVINFLPFEDLRKYVLEKEVEELKPVKVDEEYSNVGKVNEETTSNLFNYFKQNKVTDLGVLDKKDDSKQTENVTELGFAHETATSKPFDKYGRGNSPSGIDDGNFRRWFDKSPLGNVNNNDYRDYIRHDTSVAVDDHYKTTIVNDFALNSVVQKNKELTQMDDALRRMVVGIAASTGIPTEGAADALNIGFIKPILNETDKSVPVIKELGNVTNSRIVDTETTSYIGTVINEEQKEQETITDLGNVNEKGGN